MYMKKVRILKKLWEVKSILLNIFFLEAFEIEKQVVLFTLEL